ncbi:Homeodomain-like protein [Cunninghamella echinulata]|nr:Homeodomain-like protein [Cunninghamella echinulata]
MTFSFSNVHKGRWSTEEDEILLEAVQTYLKKKISVSELPWNQIADCIPNRTSVQCQSRYTEALDPMIRKGRWDKYEDELLHEAILKVGCCWIRVADCIPSRTQRQCRTRWNQIKNTRQSTKRRQQQQLQQQQQQLNYYKSSSDSSSINSKKSTLSLNININNNNNHTNQLPNNNGNNLSTFYSTSKYSLSNILSNNHHQQQHQHSPPTTPPTSIAALIIPTDDQPTQLLSTNPTSISTNASITIPKDPFTYILDHDLPSFFMPDAHSPPQSSASSTSSQSSSTSSSSSFNHLRQLDSNLSWFYES